MNKTSSIITITVIACSLMVSTAWAAKTPKTDKEKFSYSIGVQLGNNLKEMDVDIKQMVQAIEDVINKRKLKMNEQDLQKAFMEGQKRVNEKRMAERESKGKMAKKAGADFLAKNKKKKGIKTTKSGLQYQVVKKGKGASPKVADTVVAHYEGKLIDGTVFDSSYKRGQPLTIPLSNVIKGWQEAIPMMKTGGKWKIFIPSDLAYGPNGAGGNIGPNETLVFDIELLEIQNANMKK